MATVSWEPRKAALVMPGGALWGDTRKGGEMGGKGR